MTATMKKPDGVPAVSDRALATVRLIEWDKIIPNPTQPRKYFDEAALKALAENIREIGQRQPIWIKRLEKPQDGVEWMIVDGERRWRAIQRLNMLTIRAMETDAETEEELFTQSIVLNFCRQEHTPYELARAIERFDEMGYSTKKIAILFGKSESWVHQYRSLLGLDPEVASLMDPDRPESARLKLPVAMELARIPDKELQKKIAGQVLDGKMTVAKAKHHITKVAADQGVVVPREKRPERDFGYLLAIADNASDKLLRFADAPGKEFDQLLETRGVEELEILCRVLAKLGEDVQGLLMVAETIRDKAKKKRGAW